FFTWPMVIIEDLHLDKIQQYCINQHRQVKVMETGMNHDLDSSEGGERMFEPIEMAAVGITPEWEFIRHRVIGLNKDIRHALEAVEVIDCLAHIFEHLFGKARREFSMTFCVERLDHRLRSLG